jgi:carbonic anhydrase
MEHIRPLPSYLVQRYHGWKATSYTENQAWYRRLADEGQRPRGMIISCCDSRVNVSTLFGAEAGEFFIHRNVANLVPPYEPDGDPHGTSAAIEYAVTALHIPHLIVIGHSNCGGVAGCHAMCSGKAPDLEEKHSFVGRWMDILRPGFDRIDADAPEDQQLRALERQSVVVSLENLLTFPFVVEAREKEQLSLHGLWTDIREGALHQYVAETREFNAL